MNKVFKKLKNRSLLENAWFWLVDFQQIVLPKIYIQFWLFDFKIVENSMRSRTYSWLVDIKFIENSMTIEADWLISEKIKFSL